MHWYILGIFFAVVCGYFASRLAPLIMDMLRTLHVRTGNWLQRKEETDPVGPPLAYVNDEVSHDRINAFDQRTRRWNTFANWSFAFSLIGVILGIGIFIFADRIAINTPELPQLLETRNQLRSEIAEFDLKVAASHSSFIWAPEIFATWNNLSQLMRNFQAVSAEAVDDRSNVSTLRAIAQFKGWQASGETHRKTLEGLGLLEGDPQYPASALDKMKNVFSDAQLDRESFVTAVIQTLDFLKPFKNKTELTADDYVQMEEVSSLLKEHQESVSRIAEELKVAIKNSQDEVLAALSEEEQAHLVKLRSELQRTVDEIADVRQNFDPNSLYSVIPLLVVRLGAVILLIFLTQILLASYRYNTMLAAYYGAVSDSLRMVKKDSNGESPNVDEFLKLLTQLYPKDASYTVPDPPKLSELRRR